MMTHKNKIHFGIDRLCLEPELKNKLKGKRIGLVAHPASVNHELEHSLDLMIKLGLNVTCAFGPQHGMRGEKQYNMVESDDYVDPIHQIPVFSLYGKSRRPTLDMMNQCDVMVFDLQDVGCRIYTYLTTLKYVMDECGRLGKSLMVLDRPNPVGRMIEGSILKSGNESFVGVGPIIMRHGMTLGELAVWMNQQWKMNVNLEVVTMKGYDPKADPGYGWPAFDRAWISPSPNIPSLSSARCYPGAVMLEGTHLSEGRGTTRPFEGFGAPDLDGLKLLKEMHRLNDLEKMNWLSGCQLRSFYFQPTFYKHQDRLCGGVQIHVDDVHYLPEKFKPYRLHALAFKAIRSLHPDYLLWRDFPYEYVYDRLAIDVITGCDFLRTWVDDQKSTLKDLEQFLIQDEKKWSTDTHASYLY